MAPSQAGAELPYAPAGKGARCRAIASAIYSWSSAWSALIQTALKVGQGAPGRDLPGAPGPGAPVVPDLRDSAVGPCIHSGGKGRSRM